MDAPNGDPLALALENFTCDLLALARNQPVVERLFHARKGSWVSVRDLCSEVPGLSKAFQHIAARADSELMATWLGHPATRRTDGLAVVVFFLEGLLWSKTAVFNRHTLPGTESSLHKKVKASR